jgi:hypothetical protein
MKAVCLAAFTIYFLFLVWLWVRDWRAGAISRFPAFATIYRDKEPRRFKFWTVINIVIGLIFLGLVLLAWWALFTGNLK